IGFTPKIMRERCFTFWNTGCRERFTMSARMEKKRINLWPNGFSIFLINPVNSFTMLKTVRGMIAGMLSTQRKSATSVGSRLSLWSKDYQVRLIGIDVKEPGGSVSKVANIENTT